MVLKLNRPKNLNVENKCWVVSLYARLGVAIREMFPYLMGNIVDSRISINAPFLHSFLRCRPTEA